MFFFSLYKSLFYNRKGKKKHQICFGKENLSISRKISLVRKMHKKPIQMLMTLKRLWLQLFFLFVITTLNEQALVYDIRICMIVNNKAFHFKHFKHFCEIVDVEVPQLKKRFFVWYRWNDSFIVSRNKFFMVVFVENRWQKQWINFLSVLFVNRSQLFITKEWLSYSNSDHRLLTKHCCQMLKTYN